MPEPVADILTPAGLPPDDPVVDTARPTVTIGGNRMGRARGYQPPEEARPVIEARVRLRRAGATVRPFVFAAASPPYVEVVQG